MIHTKERGFTLIELLVVIAIIGLLASVILASLNTARAKGRDARRIADMKSVQTALELAYDVNSSYATTTSATPSDWTATAISSQLVPTYISAMPKDPVTGSTTYVYKYSSLDASNSASACTASCPNYIMTNTMENALPASYMTNPSTAFGGVTAGQCGASKLYCVHN